MADSRSRTHRPHRPESTTHAMTKVDLTLPQLFLIGATRGLLGVGIGLLVADRLSARQRSALGGALLGIGIASTVPLALQVFAQRHTDEQRDA
jgi:hypothetical protein